MLEEPDLMAEVEFKLVATFVPRDDPSFPPF